MTGPLEADLEAFFRKRVHLLGGLTFKVVPVEAGLPDRMVFFPGGRVYFVELKRDDGVVSKIQLERHRRLRALGTRVYVVYGREGIVTWLARITNAQTPPKPLGRPKMKAKALP